jgi:hypothetical protein
VHGGFVYQEYIYIGIRRERVWRLHLAESLTPEASEGVNVLRDLQTTMVAVLRSAEEIRSN